MGGVTGGGREGGEGGGRGGRGWWRCGGGPGGGGPAGGQNFAFFFFFSQTFFQIFEVFQVFFVDFCRWFGRFDFQRLCKSLNFGVLWTSCEAMAAQEGRRGFTRCPESSNVCVLHVTWNWQGVEVLLVKLLGIFRKC